MLTVSVPRGPQYSQWLDWDGSGLHFFALNTEGRQTIWLTPTQQVDVLFGPSEEALNETQETSFSWTLLGEQSYQFIVDRDSKVISVLDSFGVGIGTVYVTWGQAPPP